MAVLTVQTVTTAGVVPAALVAAAGGGDSFVNNGRTKFRVTNGGGGSITVTFVAQTPCNQGSTHSTVVTVGAGATEDMGPFDIGRFNDGNGLCQVTYSGVTTVTVGATSL